MKKATKKINFKKMLGIAALCFGMSNFAVAQCNASFTYTTTTSGLTATSTSTGTASTTNYSWNLSGVNPSIQVNTSNVATYNSLYNGVYTLYLYISDSSGCNSTNTQTITISGGQNPPVCDSNFTYTVTGGVVNFTSSMVDPYNATNYSWYFGGGSLGYSNVADPTYNYYYSGTYSVTLNVNNGYGCNVSSVQTVSVVTLNGPLPACTSNFTYTVGTAGQVDFTSLYTGTAPTINTVWDFGNGGNSIAPDPSYTYPYNGIYNVTLSVSDSTGNCASTTTQTVSITNTASQPCIPSVSFTIHKDSLNPQPGVWEIDANYSSQVSSAVWFWGDGSSTNGLYPTHNYATSGSYTVCVKVYSTCGDSATTCQNDSLYRMMQGYNNTAGTNNMLHINVVNATTGISQYADLKAITSVYPNPSTGIVNIAINNIADTKAQINITNILGENIYSSQETVSNNTVNKTIDMQNIANGAYFMKVIVGGKSYISKIIINK